MHRISALSIEGSRDDRAEMNFTFDSGAEHVDYALSVSECEKLLEGLAGCSTRQSCERMRMRQVVLNSYPSGGFYRLWGW
jgi:hypothetical protein